MSAEFPRYFVSVRGFAGGALYVRFDSPRRSYVVYSSGSDKASAQVLGSAIRAVKYGIWRELPASEALALVTSGETGVKP